MKIFKAALSLAFLVPVFSQAVVATTSTTTPVGPDSTWQYVGQVNGSSAVAVGRRTVLTAAHVGSGTFSLGGNNYSVASAVQAPSVTVNGQTSPTDIELLTLTSDLPGYYNLASSTTQGSGLTMVGYGITGVVDPSGDQYDLLNSQSGVRRAGANVLDDTQLVDGEGISLLSYLRKAGDAVLAGGDSGGGWFDSSGNLLGINAFYFNDTDLGPTPPGDNAPPPKLPDYGFSSANKSGFHFHNNQPGWTFDIDIAAGDPYFGSGAIDVTNPTIRNWIVANTVPEPTTIAALGLGLICLLRRRRVKA